MLPLTTLPSGRVVQMAPGNGLEAGAALPPKEDMKRKMMPRRTSCARRDACRNRKRRR